MSTVMPATSGTMEDILGALSPMHHELYRNAKWAQLKDRASIMASVHHASRVEEELARSTSAVSTPSSPRGEPLQRIRSYVERFNAERSHAYGLQRARSEPVENMQHALEEGLRRVSSAPAGERIRLPGGGVMYTDTWEFEMSSDDEHRQLADLLVADLERMRSRDYDDEGTLIRVVDSDDEHRQLADLLVADLERMRSRDYDDEGTLIRVLVRVEGDTTEQELFVDRTADVEQTLRCELEIEGACRPSP